MARRDRAPRARADRSARPRAACPLSRCRRRLQRRRTADRVSRFAGARARVPARAGSAHRLRARAERGGRARAQSGGRPAQQGAGDRRLDRAQRLCAAEGRRGLVLVDPAFEDAGDFARLARALAAAHRKWASGIYLAWYPIKERAAPDGLARRLRESGMAKILRVELSVAAPRAATRLGACGLIVINRPWMLAGELAILLPALAVALAGAGECAHRVDWLAGEK